MAVTATESKQLVKREMADGTQLPTSRKIRWPNLGVRARQIALITLLVVLVVVATTLANIAYLTGTVINSAKEQTEQHWKQIRYHIEQTNSRELVGADVSPYTAMTKEGSEVRTRMESIFADLGPIVYVYLSDAEGNIVKDSDGKHELAVNRHMIGDPAEPKPDLERLAKAGLVAQLYHILISPPVYEFSREIAAPPSKLHIGVSAHALREQVQSPIRTYLIIGLLAILGGTLVAISSANLLLKPLEAISTSIERLQSGAEPTAEPRHLPRDQMLTSVATQIKQLGERLAGERSELEIMRGRLRQVISHLEERLLLLNREGRVILASPDAEQFLEMQDTELTGLPIDETLGAEHPLVKLVERAFSERRSVARTTIQVLGAARTRQLIASIQFIEDAGEPVGALVSLRDYESFQKFESQWDLSKKLADLGRITSGIAHEVKNPLNAMVIHLEILRSKLESGSGDPSPQIEILDSEIKRLDRVVATFLNFTRPVEVRLEPCDLNRIVNQVVMLASTEAEDRGVTIYQELSPQPLMIKGDSDLLKQALLNIIINGCQAMPEGGPLRVSTLTESDGTAHIRVSDRGVGIPPETRDRIFNLYHTTKKHGSGIGLAQAYRAVQLHNGQIRFDSEIGTGTTFEIILPALA